MRNQRVIGRAALGLEYFGDRSFIKHISAEAINGLGRKRRDTAIFDKGGGFGG